MRHGQYEQMHAGLVMDIERRQTRVVIAICTFNRPEGLSSVLNGVAHLDIDDYKIALRVIVVDNSEDANARDFILEASGSYRWPLTYHHEAQRGISFARNTALRDAVHGEDDYIAFIDDDEYPETGWITTLLEVAYKTDAAAVSGVVKARFAATPAWWIAKGNFFYGNDYPDQEPVCFGHTGNALVRLQDTRTMGLKFDPRFALTGGEDTLFFQEMRDAGGRTVFSRGAVVYENIVPERATLSWFAKRWYRSGDTDGRIILIRSGRPLGTALNLSSGVVRVSVGAAGVLATVSLLLCRCVHMYRFMRIACRGAGFIWSVVGAPYEEYRIHDR